MPYESSQTNASMGKFGKECPRCGATFFCEVREGCWCGNRPLTQETLEQLRNEYIDCLCPTCLKQFESQKN